MSLVYNAITGRRIRLCAELLYTEASTSKETVLTQFNITIIWLC